MILKGLPDIWVIAPLCLLIIGTLAWQLWAHRRSMYRKRWVVRTLIGLLTMLLLLRPALPGGSAEAGITNIDVVFTVDTTSSIAAEDYDGSKQRLEGIKSDVRAISEEMAGARFTLVSFNALTTIDAPLSTDASALDAAVGALHPEISFYSVGSTISQPLDILKEQLANMKERNPDRKIVLYYFGDGEQTSNKPIESLEPLRQYISGGAVLGYGTQNGGRMQIYGENFSSGSSFIQDMSSFPYKDAVSKIDESNLKQLASELSLPYVHRIKPGSVDSLIADSGSRKLANQPDKKSYQDLYWIIAIIVVALIVFDAYTIRHTILDLRKRERL